MHQSILSVSAASLQTVSNECVRTASGWEIMDASEHSLSLSSFTSSDKLLEEINIIVTKLLIYSTDCLGEWIVVVGFTGFDKAPLHPSSAIRPSLAQSIPDFFLKPVKRGDRFRNHGFDSAKLRTGTWTGSRHMAYKMSFPMRGNRPKDRLEFIEPAGRSAAQEKAFTADDAGLVLLSFISRVLPILIVLLSSGGLQQLIALFSLIVINPCSQSGSVISGNSKKDQILENSAADGQPE
ncbi:hypothetical protein MUK42_18762 [Musa troglodytarum]|uniref:Uncharacterized protein n=1 Tax=Musa troglodytarum TaxID=320322 RepID=A0A9E7HQT6_9LILI|nr:hypothetical protein MUK42_18762 [Musa troglodytarum]